MKLEVQGYRNLRRGPGGAQPQTSKVNTADLVAQK